MSEQGKWHTAPIVASIAHDLRTPLNAVIGFSRVMLKGIDGPLSEVQTTDLQAIHSNGQAMLEIVDDLIDLAKVEARWLTSAPTPVHVPLLVQKARSSPQVASQVLQVISPEGEDLPPVHADLAQAQKAIDRLVEAAVHLSGPGETALELCANETDVTVTVTCTSAEGLAPEAPHVLEAFRTSGASTEHRVNRVSLKLLVSGALAAANGGSLQVIRESQTELVLEMRLPLSPSASALGH